MAQIPDYTAVGTQVPVPSYRRVMPDESGRIIAGGIESLGRGLEESSDELANFARAKASNALLDQQLAVKNTTEDIRQKMASGEITWDQAPQAYADAIGKMQPPQIKNLDNYGQLMLQRGIERNTTEGQFAVAGIARAGRKQAFADQFEAAQDKLGKLAGMPDADIEGLNGQLDSYKPMALEAGIPAAAVDKAIQNFKDRNWFNNAVQTAMQSKDSMPDLKQLEHDLTAADGFYAGKLDTDKRNAVLRTVVNDRLILENRAEHEQDKREAKAQSALRTIDEQISSGVPATPTMWAQWEDVTKGTSAEGDFKQRLKDESQVQEVLRQPIEEQFKFVQGKEQQLDTQGGSLRDRANLMRLSTAVRQNANLMENQPLLFAANRNGIDVQPVDFSGAGSEDGKAQIAATISDRMSTIHALREQYGPQIGMQPLLPQETAQLHSQLDSATPPERAQLLTSLRDAFNNDDAYQSVLRRIAPGSPVTAIAGQMTGAMAPASTPAWYDRTYAPKKEDVERVLRGEALLNPAAGGKEATAGEEKGKGALKTGMPMPPDKELQQRFGREAAGLFEDRPQLADAYYSVFKSAYAALLAEKGDMRGTGSSGLEAQALKIALGTKVDVNGSSLSVPAGMDPTRFAGLVQNAVADAATRMKAPENWPDYIRGYQLRELGGLGSGRYELRNGNVPVASPDGNGSFKIDLRNQYLPGSAGAASSEKIIGTEGTDYLNKAAMGKALAAQAPQP